MESRIYNLSVSIASVHRSIQRIKANALSKFGMNNIHVMCIYSIGRNPGISAAKICKGSAIDKAAASKAIKELISLGHIDRPIYEKRAYRAELFLTESGKKLFDIVKQKMKEASKLALKDIENKEYEELLRTLKKIEKTLTSS